MKRINFSNYITIHLVLLALIISGSAFEGEAQIRGVAAPTPNVNVAVEPQEGGKVVYAPISASKAGGKDGAQLSLKLLVKNNGTSNLNLSKAIVKFVGPPYAVAVAFDLNKVIKPGDTEKVHLQEHPSLPDGKYFNFKLSSPPPLAVKIELKFNGYNSPVVVSKQLAPHKNSTPQGSYLFPAKTSDLKPGEYWGGASSGINSHHGNDERFAYDMGVAAWDPEKGEWTNRKPGTSGAENSHYLVWGKKLYAVADGVIERVVNDQPDKKPNTPTISGPNLVEVRHGDEIVQYLHLMKGSIAPGLKKGVAVKAGQFLGRVGNSGKSSHPHLHIDVIQKPVGGSGHLRPLMFRNIHVIDRSALDPSDESGPWVKVNGKSLPWVKIAIWPASTPPKPLPSGYAEVAKHGVPASNYQQVFGNITSSGYYPVWVDGFDVNGKTFFNAIFRPNDGTKWAAKHGLNSAQYQAEFNLRISQGYNPHQVESYLQNGDIRYAVIFVKKSGPAFKAYHGRTPAQHQQLIESYTKAGFRPVNVSVVSKGGQRFYTALYRKINVGSFEARSFLTAAQYQAEFNQNQAAGRKLVYVNAYIHAGSVRFSAIWQSAASNNYKALHGLSSSSYQTAWNSTTGQGYLTQAVTGYEAGDKAYFAALWRK